jgi:hypothetical protein
MNEGTNSLKTSTGYISINNPGEGSEFAEIYDSPTLLPLSLPANTNKQYWVTIFIPSDTPSGLYTGTISIKNNGETISEIKLKVEVLPFELPESPIDISLYYSQYISTDGKPTLSQGGKSVEQLHKEFQNLKKHGVLNPSVYANYFITPIERFTTYIQIRQEENMSFDDIYYCAGALGEASQFLTVSLINQNVPLVMNYFNNCGTKNVYFYCPDEQSVVPFSSQILAARVLGAKSIDAQDSSEALLAYNYNPPLLDCAIMGGAPVKSVIDAYHSKGLLIGSYGNPQSGLENPLLYRKNYGLLLWQKDIDISCTFAYEYGNYLTGKRLLWNDWNWDGTNRYKIHTFVYPTTNGVVDTIEWEGFREGVNDIRYVAKLEQVISDSNKSTSSAQAYLDTLKLTNIQSLNMAEVRNEVINHILSLTDNNLPGFDFPVILIGIFVLLFIMRLKK